MTTFLVPEAEIQSGVEEAEAQRSDAVAHGDIKLAMYYAGEIAVYESLRNLAVREKRGTGRWERHYSRPNVYADLCWHCSACGYASLYEWTKMFNYCPNCGAKMKGAEENE